VIGEVYLSNEMISAGVDALDEAAAKKLTKAQTVAEVYMAMAGMALKTAYDGEATVQ